MKKTLVALAVLAASSATFAQVAVTGTYKYGFKSTTNLAGVSGSDTSGLGVDTSYLQFTGTEDLGGGMKATAIMSIDGLNRAGVSGGDSSVAIEGGFGKFNLYNGRGPDVLSDYVKSAVGMDGKVFSAVTASDGIAYLTPELVPGLKIQVQHVETAPSQGAGEAVSPIGIGVGAAGAQVIQRRNDIRLQYASGPLAAAINYLVYDQQGDATLSPNANTTATRGYVRYDFGVARVGAALYELNYQVGKRTDSIVAVNVPFGKIDFGATWAQRKVDGRATATLNGTIDGTALSAQYNLSKRTAVVGTYSTWGVVNKSTVTETAVLLSHSF